MNRGEHPSQRRASKRTSGTGKLTAHMATGRTGTLVHWQQASPLLVVFRLAPENGCAFPSYLAGQYIALRRDDCKLTRKSEGSKGEKIYIPDVDPSGNPRIGPVTHSYSIASAPFETAEQGHLEFYVILEKGETGQIGRLTESMFRMSVDADPSLRYVERIVGDFTLDKRAAGFDNVAMVGTGTGVAPFVSMIKQLDYEARQGRVDGVAYTLFHVNRTLSELDYYDELSAIAQAGRFDFTYVPAVSRAGSSHDSRAVGLGRANNLLRSVLDMPLKEEQDLDAATASGGDVARARATLERTTRPVLPGSIDRAALLNRLAAGKTVVLNCGSALSMADIEFVAQKNDIRFEKEDW